MGPGIFQAALGAKQTKEANAIKQNLVRPDMPIAQGYQKQLGMAQNNLQSRYFSGQKNLENRLENDVAGGVGNMIGRGGSAAGILGGLTELEKKKMDQSLTIGNTALEDWNQRQGNLANAYGNMGQQEMNKWAWDKQAKFQADALAAAGLTGAGIQNKSGALQGLTQAAVQFLGSPAGQNFINGIGENRRDNAAADDIIRQGFQNQTAAQMGQFKQLPLSTTNANPSNYGNTTGQLPGGNQVPTFNAPGAGVWNTATQPYMVPPSVSVNQPTTSSYTPGSVTGNLPGGPQVPMTGNSPYNGFGSQPSPSYTVPPNMQVNMPSGVPSQQGSITGSLPGGVAVPPNGASAAAIAQMFQDQMAAQMGQFRQLPLSMGNQGNFNYGNITGSQPLQSGQQVPQSSNPYQSGTWGQAPSSLFDMMNALNSVNFSKF